ncbi:penicillin-binding transpeptidase domain-containing protein [Streptacidiphilus neutrinimicus]|uniref:penicillin-binding transpeptidase domain-containing protein n=1 Tax=Streptacidiphilus neutrinimicus TaxID=105420 RepID=UPI000AE19ADA|nr:penicillin-binding transpeptidase domain-containing protein [Streptacidiphilus neutrinimicus]
MHKGAKIAVATVVAAMLAGGGYAAFNVGHAVLGSPGGPATFNASDLSTSAPSGTSAQTQATAFLQAWQAGPDHYADAGKASDSPLTTQAALQKYHDGLGLTGISFSHIAATGATSRGGAAETVGFDVSAQVKGGTWTYKGSLDVVQSSNGKTAVRWAPSVLFPSLGDGQSLQAGPVTTSAASTTITDQNGAPLTGAQFPSLQDILSTIAQNATASGGASGTGVEVVDASGSDVAAAKVFSQPKAATIKTTIDAKLQAAAEHAVKLSQLQNKSTGVVVVRPSDGHILAIAYSGSDGDIAINASQPPGSSMKILTSAALFDQAGMRPSSTAQCLTQQPAESETFHNESDVPNLPQASLEEDFARSCNTGFIWAAFDKLVQHGQPSSALADEATNVFGFGDWHIGGGVQTKDPSVPTDEQLGDNPAQFIGQGRVTASPLVMASVAATVQHGSFKQPILLPDQQQSAAPSSLSATTDRYLQEMMRAVVREPYGTANPVLGDLSGTVGAKTGTAETPNNGTDGWMTAYNDDIAVSSVVIGGSSGAGTAGYVVRALLQASGS